MNKRIGIWVFIVLSVLAVVSYRGWSKNRSDAVTTTLPFAVAPVSIVPKKELLEVLVSPLDRLAERVTKKPFGLRVSQKNSPVSPERFSGYHTGVDFETFADEKDAGVTVHAACSGTVLLRRWVSGYGGVLIQSCTLDGKDVTVLYGHLNVASITLPVKTVVLKGQVVGNLGKGYSKETDGERKHLHFSIHKGGALNFRGYVQTPSELEAWTDPMKYLSQ